MSNTKKINWYESNKQLSARVLEYGDAKLWSIILRTKAAAKIAKINASIANLEELKGSVLDEGDKIETMRKDYLAKIDSINEKLEKDLEKSANFSYTDNDKKFYKAYKSATNDKELTEAVVDFLAFYGVNGADTKDVSMLVNSIKGARKLGSGAIVRSNGTQFTSDKRTKSDIMNIVYGKLCELLVNAGTIKLTSIPEDVRAYYAPKKNKKDKASSNRSDK